MAPPIRTDRRGKMQLTPPAPKPTIKTVTITKEQAESVAKHKAEAEVAAAYLNKVLEGILAGFGHVNAQITDFDAAKRTLTFQVRSAPAAVPPKA